MKSRGKSQEPPAEEGTPAREPVRTPPGIPHPIQPQAVFAEAKRCAPLPCSQSFSQLDLRCPEGLRFFFWRHPSWRRFSRRFWVREVLLWNVGLIWVVGLLGGCEVAARCGGERLTGLDPLPRLAVVQSDFVSTSVALLDGEGGVVHPHWVDSGMQAPGVVAALTGDVVLPSNPVAGQLTLLDRFGVDVVNGFELATGTVVGQWPTQLPRAQSTSGFRANPHDVIPWGEGQLLVSRYEPNLDGSAPDLDRGNDVVWVDTIRGQVTARFDLSPWDESLAQEGQVTRVFARPDRLIALEGEGSGVLVGLGRLDASFFSAADGLLLWWDPDTGDTEALVLDGLANCGQIKAAPGDRSVVWVVCSGDTFVDSDGRRARSGVVRVEMDPMNVGGRLQLDGVWYARDYPDVLPPSHGLVPGSGTQAWVVAMGHGVNDVPDALLQVDVEPDGSLDVQAVNLNGDNAPVTAFVLGEGAYDPDMETLWLPDTEVGLRRFQSDGESLTEQAPVLTETCSGMPTRQVGLLN